MAVKRCPSCGDLYLVAVERCASCDVVLVEVGDDAERPRRSTPRVEPSSEHERRELHGWTMEGRRLLDGMLDRTGIPRSWQGATLLTPELEHDRVEEMVELVAAGDARVGVDEDPDHAAVGDTSGAGASEIGEDPASAPEPAGDEVGYDLSGWTDLARGDLIAALAEDGIEHGWDADGDLVVSVADEARVDAVFERLTGDEASAGESEDDEGDLDEPDDGLLVQETLSDLFVAADRLARNPLDGGAGELAVDAEAQVRTLRLPFGFERPQWRTILETSAALAESVEQVPRDDDAIKAHASTLRARLRDIV